MNFQTHSGVFGLKMGGAEGIMRKCVTGESVFLVTVQPALSREVFSHRMCGLLSTLWLREAVIKVVIETFRERYLAVRKDVA